MSAAFVSSQLKTLLANEWRLSWRGIVDFVTRRGADGKAKGSPARLVLLIALLFVLVHGIAYALTLQAGPMAADDHATLVRLTATLAFAFLLMVSAGLDSAAFTLYSRSDYEMLFSSPAPPRAVFIIRAFNIFLFTGAKVFLYGAPFINVMAWRDGLHWLVGYGIVAALTALATLVAVATAMGLVALIGIKRTRVTAQVLAAVVGLGVFLLLQRDLLMPQSLRAAGEAWFLSLDPSVFSTPLFWPAIGMLGGVWQALAALFCCAAIAGLGLYALAKPFYRASIAAAGAPAPVAQALRPERIGFGASPFRVLISKERKLVLRDPWLLSQILTQSLFMAPLAAIAIKHYVTGEGDGTLFVPMFVVLAGQIAGGLTWIALSADDAPDLIGTAPQSKGLIRRAKLATICYLTVLFVTVPLIIVLWTAPEAGLFAFFGMLLGAAAAVQINIWHQPRPGLHERRQRKSSNSTLINLAEIVVLMLIAGVIWLFIQGEFWPGVLLATLAAMAMMALYMMRRPGPD
jgi:ABC-2 type transport system permease protein